MVKTYAIKVRVTESEAVPESAEYFSAYQEMVRACTARLTAASTSRKCGAKVDLISISSTEV